MRDKFKQTNSLLKTILNLLTKHSVVLGAAPTTRPELDGKWQLLYTSRPGTASPIQRTFVGVDAFSVFQEVTLLEEEARVNNIVDFGSNIGYLKVQASRLPSNSSGSGGSREQWGLASTCSSGGLGGS
jgi:hypothetical protein